MRRSIATFIFGVFSLVAYTQTTIELRVNQPVGSAVHLLRYEGSSTVDLDSCRPTPDGIYRFTLPSKALRGLYKLQVRKGGAFDFIVTDEPLILFETYSFAIEDSLIVRNSADNSIFISFRKFKQTAIQKMWHLESLMKFYTNDSVFGQMLRNEYQRTLFDLYVKANEWAQQATHSIVSSAIRLEVKPFVPALDNECLTRKELNEVWWKGIDLNIPEIRFLPNFISRFWDYIENMLCEGAYSKEEQDSLFVLSLKRFFDLPMHDSVRVSLLNSACNGFGESDYYGVINFLISKGQLGPCSIFDDIEFRTKLALESELLPGKKGMDFKISPLQGKNIKLSRLNAQYTLLIFWSVWCPHCIESLPYIKNIYDDYKAKGFEVVAVCIDDEIDTFRNFVEQNNLKWINTRIPYSISSKVLLSYHVDETPKMFLIDKNLTIVSRPSSPEQLRAKLNKLLP